MSGFVALVNFDGAPVDTALLENMTASLIFRGPDDQRTWARGGVGFGHTLLRTTFEAEHEIQPLSHDGTFCIVADLRIDARAELVAKLNAKGLPADISQPDVELVLHAFHAWGTDCVNHLLGDFAFCIWDARQRRMFCARDHMGIKPLFYSQINHTLIISNTLDCIRRHPATTSRLNELAVADFLLFGYNQEKNTSIFADIQRIPPAHTALWTDGRRTLHRYWTLPVEDPIHYRRSQDYIERFIELLDVAVADRLRTPRVGIFMSGGLDSTTLAATATRLLRTSGDKDSTSVCAFTVSLPDYDGNERFYASLTADFLGIQIVIEDGACANADPDWYKSRVQSSEPVIEPFSILHSRASYQCTAAFSPVAFYGEGPDNALHHEWAPYVRHMLRQRKLTRLLRDIGAHTVSHRTIPLIPGAIRGLLRHQEKPDGAQFPSWINPDFVNRLGLRERWQDITAGQRSQHPVRPVGHASFAYPLWQVLFDDLDAANTRSPLEVRHPYLDLRLLRFLLAVPSLPWCRRKLLIRRAMNAKLPSEVLHRPKTPLSGNPREHPSTPLQPPAEGTEKYFTSDAWRPQPSVKHPGPENSINAWAFSFWLESYMTPLS